MLDDKEIEQYIDAAIDRAINRLKLEQIGYKPNRYTDAEKVERLLEMYKALSIADGRQAKEVVSKIDKGLQIIADGALIKLLYIDGASRSEAAAVYNVTETTISRRKRKAIEELIKIIL